MNRPRASFPTAALLLLTVAMTAGCATLPNIPPITTDSGAVASHGKFVWHELLTEDLDAVKAFYSDLFGWTYQATDAPNYTLVLQDGRPICGIVDVKEENADLHESQWISVLSVADVDEAVAATRQAGGKVHVKPVDLPGRGRLAVVSDPQGAVIAYLRAVHGDPPDRSAEIGEWLWTELWTSDLDAAEEFYEGLVGYELETRTILEDIEYKVFTAGGTPRAGLILKPMVEVGTHWLPYVRVEDPAEIVGRVEALGGHVILAPSEDARKGTAAIVIDPSGAAVALQKWPAS